MESCRRQAAVYVACLSAMKVVVLLLFWAFPGTSPFSLLLLPSASPRSELTPPTAAEPALFKFANWCLSWLPSDDAQVVFVMLIFPRALPSFSLLLAFLLGALAEPPLMALATVVMNLFQFLTSASHLLLLLLLPLPNLPLIPLWPQCSRFHPQIQTLPLLLLGFLRGHSQPGRRGPTRVPGTFLR